MRVAGRKFTVAFQALAEVMDLRLLLRDIMPYADGKVKQY